ncbi:alkaline phosphatase synthesis sensor protein PhoR [Pleomorphomonas sp. SM30]|uniref:histidine kinase n=1 Tax=Oharaeibacter diazotrophicus TaxID=1920512 RepID=A0A4R6RDR7_9HYPH|nr:ATP-binding protein [Oharaeibacter diazotrophicus]TDP84339.1 two-component system phosphate regulon sensor histidine kinase PhoR [Oharaeibacter diazotrophicus]BBE73376.1 alkaline phosphatase synthesis sensor protein PhoR [Pleomorphomonas sp. SM30]
MADGEERAGRTMAGRAVRRLAAAAPGLLVVAAAAVAAIPSFDLPPLAAATAVAGALATALWPRPRETAPRIRAGADRSPKLWPDPGMRVTVDAIDDPCFVTDAEGVVRYQNRIAVERFGAARMGDPLSFKLRVPELLAAVEQAGRHATPGALRFTDRVPTERVWAVRVTPMLLGRREGRERADFVLVRLTDETEQVRLDRTRADFVANASHELRTPLASLTGFVETLLGPARDDAANRERFLKIMLEQAQRMARLIDDLLSLSRVEMKAHLVPSGAVDPDEVIRHVAAALAPLAASTGSRIAVEGEVDATVRGDRDEIIQVVSNLVENGLKYGRDGGTVTLAVVAEAGPEGVSGVRLTVRDDGPGIAAEHLPRLTERFYRVDADGSRRRKGTGLGLAIVKHVVARHRGRLAIRSTPGVGTEVAVWLPATPVAAAVETGATAREGP